MWGYIRKTPNIGHKDTVPSLYVRVYRAKLIQFPIHRRSLIICEGISQHNSREVKRLWFPHYMWGYIGIEGMPLEFILVPSLYVRVYRTDGRHAGGRKSSLIICEGISKIHLPFVINKMFPHYMWGYIIYFVTLIVQKIVPSLYVRVYRVHLYETLTPERSLIICEGISLTANGNITVWRFPHYMWGYIVALTGLLFSHLCSLIICEGISSTRQIAEEFKVFPHYMWGYISTISSR